MRTTLIAAALLLCAGVVVYVWRDSEWVWYLRSTPNFLVFGLPNEHLQDEAVRIETAAKAALPPGHDVLVDDTMVDARAGEKGLFVRPTELDVYNVTDIAGQERIIGAVRDAVKISRMPVRIDFLEQHPAPGHPKAGSPVTKIRSVTVKPK